MLAKQIAIAVTTSLIFLNAACAETAARGPVATYCAQEISRYCAQERHGAGGVRSCLESNWRRLSDDCRAVLGRTGGGQRWR
jgi:hypothetical protein